jgi:hypothetical protein
VIKIKGRLGATALSAFPTMVAEVEGSDTVLGVCPELRMARGGARSTDNSEAVLALAQTGWKKAGASKRRRPAADLLSFNPRSPDPGDAHSPGEY